MENQNFLKHINIIYVEDEEILKEKTSDIFNLSLNKVYTASNGKEALDLYLNLIKENKRIDAIISDINMPIMNGIDLFKEIRRYDEDIPLFLSTAYIENQYLFDALKVNVYSYFTKPVNFEKLFKKLISAVKKFHHNDTIRKQKNELEKYLEAINSTAIISKTDTKGIITYVNDIFCETSKYTKDELLGKPHNIIRHPDNSKSMFSDLWKTIRAGKSWKGKLKNKAKDDSTYYVNTTIIPVFNDDFTDEIIEFIGIRFLTTDEEIQKREFRKNVLKNIQDMNKKKLLLTKEIEELKSNSHLIYENKISELNKIIIELENKNLKQLDQLDFSEQEIKSLRQKNSNISAVANNKINTISSKFDAQKLNSKKLENNIQELNNIITDKNKEIEALQSDLEFKDNYIENLNETIYMKQKQLDKHNCL